MKISALWITKNEETDIANSINSVKAIADEIVVVDTGSTDDTIKIVKSLGARVEHFGWVDDFSAARNYALKQVDGDIVVFLDADEWFVPALRKEDRVKLEMAFSNPEVLVLDVLRNNIDPDTQLTLDADESVRALRGRGAGQYVGPIHEFIQAQGKQRHGRASIDGWVLWHSGYSKERRPEKLLRNIALLEAAIPGLTGEMQKALYHYYLMRESSGLGRGEQALEALLWLVGNPSALRKFLESHPSVGIAFPYDALRLIRTYRGELSRRQMRRALVDSVEAVYGELPVGISYGLCFDQTLDEREGDLLARIDPVLGRAELARGNTTAELGQYLYSLSVLYAMAGEAAWRRGDREKAFDYVSKAINYSGSQVMQGVISLLLRTVKGLPIADIIVFLNSVLEVESAGILELLIATLQFEGYKDLYTYYVKKMLDAGVAKKSDFWYLMIVLGNAEAACKAAMEAKDETEEDVVQRTLFLAAAATESIELFEQYKEEMGNYHEALDLMFYNKAGDKVNYGIVVSNYQLVAFAGGRPAANRLSAAYRGFENVAFTTRMNYYGACGLYAEFLRENSYVPEETDTSKWVWLAECEMRCGNSAKTLEILEKLPTQANISNAYFNLLDALAVRANPEVSVQARALYEAYEPMYQEFIDYNDVVNTGVVLDADSKKQRKALSELTPEGFEKRVSPAEVAPFKRQLGTLRSAAGVYAKKKSYVAAVDCLCKALSLGDASPMTYTALAEIFTTLENEPLAGYLREQYIPEEPFETETEAEVEAEIETE